MNRHLRRTDRRQRQHAADRQINAAADNHQRHATGQDAIDGCLPQRVAMRAHFEERSVPVKNQAEQQHQQQR